MKRESMTLSRLLGSSGFRVILFFLIMGITVLSESRADADWYHCGPAASTGCVNDIKIVNSKPWSIYIATEGGIFKSTDGGVTWAAINNGLKTAFMRCLALHPTHPKTVYAGSYGQGIFKTTDGGENWVQIHAGGDVTALVVNPLTPNTVFAGTWGGGVLKSSDAGASWHAVNSGLTGANLYIKTMASAITDSTPKTLYVTTWGIGQGEGGVFKTKNGGGSWKAVNDGLPKLSGPVVGIYGLAVSPSSPKTIYAAGEEFMYKTTNGASSWKIVDTAEDYFSVAINPSKPKIVYGGSVHNGIYKSANGGSSWAEINAGLPPSSPSDPNHAYEVYDPAFSLAFHPAYPDIVYAGTKGGHGVYVQPGAPGAPKNVSAKAQNGDFVVSFAPGFNGGVPLIQFTVIPYIYSNGTLTDTGVTGSASSSPVTISRSSLFPNVPYVFTVYAENEAGKVGPESSHSNIVTLTAPGAPTGVTAKRGNAQATVSFSPPASDGGSPITSYYAISVPGGGVQYGTGSPLTVTGLKNGYTYRFLVYAKNAFGTSKASEPSNSVIPATVPGIPTHVRATAGDAQATVQFTAPSSSGGVPIKSYKVISSPGGVSKSGIASPITVTGLTNNTEYTFTVQAINAVGSSRPSDASDPVTPKGRR